MKYTKRILWSYHQELEQLHGSILRIFFSGKINEFYKDNGIRINTLSDQIRELRTKYFQMDHEQKLIFGDDKKPLCLEGVTMDDYQEAYNNLMDEECAITL